MKEKTWYVETLHEDMRTSFYMEEILYHTKSRHHEIVIFTNKTLGRTLAIDNIIQSCEADEYIYHEMLVHPALVSYAPQDVLIIGGGDGGTAREVLKHPVRSLVMVDIDEEVVSLCRKYLPHHSAGVFEDDRFELMIADGAQFVASLSRRFDCILIDSTDCTGAGEVLFSKEFYHDCLRALTKSGVMVNHNGVPFLQKRELQSWMTHAVGSATHGGYYCAAIPFYVGGVMAFGWAGAENHMTAIAPELIDKRLKNVSCRYYSSAVHHAALATPAS